MTPVASGTTGRQGGKPLRFLPGIVSVIHTPAKSILDLTAARFAAARKRP